MTLNQLHKRLGKLIEEGHGRRKVCVDKETFTHNCEDEGVVILDVSGVGVETITIMVDDSTERADGSERLRQTVVLVGDDAADKNGNIVRRKW